MGSVRWVVSDAVVPVRVVFGETSHIAHGDDNAAVWFKWQDARLAIIGQRKLLKHAHLDGEHSLDDVRKAGVFGKEVRRGDKIRPPSRALNFST
jgi:hypothetical protein